MPKFNLSAAQQVAIVNVLNGARTEDWATANLVMQGLVDYRRRYWFFGPKVLVLTRLGLAAVAEFMENTNAD